MSIDVSQFHQTFFDESFEGLEAMEAALLALEPQAAIDDEVVNAIFRAAHSIKGGAGTFGFLEISAFTHLLETLLDELRSGSRAWSDEIVSLLLRGVDTVREMLQNATEGDQTPADAELSRELELLLGSEDARTAQPVGAVLADDALRDYHIVFAPDPDIVQQGNDPLRILRALGALGALELSIDGSALPAFADHEPETCPLRWDIRLRSAENEDAIREIFAWVEDACELSIECAQKQPAEINAIQAPVVDVPGDGSSSGAAPRRASASESSIRVAVNKIDALINLVGELVITEAMLQQLAAKLDPVNHETLLNALGQLDRNTRHLQEAVMSTRMLPVEFVFRRFPRLVRDTAGKLGKSVVLETEGEGTELDKGVIEQIIDPLNHIVRNAVDHGIESPEERAAAGKPERATVRLSARHQGGHIVIAVSDDGRGLDRDKLLDKAASSGLSVNPQMSDAEVWQLIFAPGFSTASAVTDLSGRGVGMDVVKKNIQALGGQAEVQSTAGQGTTVTIRLPLTLAILDGLTVAVGNDTFILPLNCIVESQRMRTEDIQNLTTTRQLLRFRGEFVPLLSVAQCFGLAASGVDPSPADDTAIVVIVEAEGGQLALIVDELVGQQQVVIKSLETNYQRIPGISGATILGDGRVALIIDVANLIRLTRHQEAA